MIVVPLQYEHGPRLVRGRNTSPRPDGRRRQGKDPDLELLAHRYLPASAIPGHGVTPSKVIRIAVTAALSSVSCAFAARLPRDHRQPRHF